MATQRFQDSQITDFVKHRSMLAGNLSIYAVHFLVLAGGGAGGGSGDNPTRVAGGGGAGGYRTSYGISGENSLPLSEAFHGSFTVTVGAGGAGVSGSNRGSNGSNSVFGSITSLGGGGGGASAYGGGANGGSGGGSNNTAVGLGTASEGFNGSSGLGTQNEAGGGGGASQIGVPSITNRGGRGGNGISSDITGSYIMRAGGGSGGSRNQPLTTSGGGGGQGGYGVLYQNPPPFGAQSGQIQTGAGGGGTYDENLLLRAGGAGGSGLVVLRYNSAFTISIGAGLTGTTTTVGTDKVTTFTAGTGTVSWS